MASEEHKPYTPGYKHVSHHEWRNAENSAAYFLPILKEQVAKKPNLRLLDIGCGSGTITASLAKYMPSGSITAVDLTEAPLAKTKKFAEQAGVINITTKQGSVFDLVKDFGEGSFDLVHTSMMLVHLDQPIEALRQMIKVCKPGGVVAAREADLRMMDMFPMTPALRKSFDAMLVIHARNGGTIDGGIKMLDWALQAGAKRDQVTFGMGTWCWCTPEERRMWADVNVLRLTEGPQRKETIEHGGMTEAEIDEVVKDFKAWVDIEGAAHSSMHGELLIRL